MHGNSGGSRKVKGQGPPQENDGRQSGRLDFMFLNSPLLEIWIHYWVNVHVKS